MKEFFTGNYETVTLDGKAFEKREDIEAALTGFKVSNSDAFDFAQDLSRHIVHDSEHMYVATHPLTPADFRGFEVPTGGEKDNGKEAVTVNTTIESLSGDDIYILLTYDI